MRTREEGAGKEEYTWKWVKGVGEVAMMTMMINDGLNWQGCEERDY